MALVVKDEDNLLFKTNDYSYVKRKIQESEDKDADVVTSTYNA